MSLKPSHSIQELPAFVCCELRDIKLRFPLPCVCVFSPCLSQKTKKKKKVTTFWTSAQAHGLVPIQSWINDYYKNYSPEWHNLQATVED